MAAANEAGGVHYDAREDGTSLVLSRLVRAAGSAKHPVLGSTVIGIARVVLAPLLAAVRARDA